MNEYLLLISALIKEGVLHTPALIDAFKCVDRMDFVPESRKELAYEDIALPIGHDQTVSQPFTVAFMLELLAPQVGEKILDVGSGSGWTTTLLAEVVGPAGKVFGVERIPELVALGKKNLAKYAYSQAVIVEVGEKLGLPEQTPFDRILVSAAAAKLPWPLIDQLKVGGVMVIPIKNSVQKVTKLSNEKVEIEKYEGFEFVPLW